MVLRIQRTGMPQGLHFEEEILIEARKEHFFSMKRLQYQKQVGGIINEIDQMGLTQIIINLEKTLTMKIVRQVHSWHTHGA